MDSKANINTSIEPWVDADTVATHLGFESDHVRNLARAGKIPATQMGNGKRKFWRFKISHVDAALASVEQHISASIDVKVIGEAVGEAMFGGSR